MGRVLCSDEGFFKRLIYIYMYVKKEKERKKCIISFVRYVQTIINSWIFFFMIHEATRYTQYQSYR